MYAQKGGLVDRWGPTGSHRPHRGSALPALGGGSWDGTCSPVGSVGCRWGGTGLSVGPVASERTLRWGRWGGDVLLGRVGGKGVAPLSPPTWSVLPSSVVRWEGSVGGAFHLLTD